MGPIPFAFSVHHFINSVGADAGFASIIGLAILVLLYFAQARETSSLREQLVAAAQRMQQLEARQAQLSRLGAPSGPQPSPGPSSQPASAHSQAPGRQSTPGVQPVPAPQSTPVAARGTAAAAAGAGTVAAPGPAVPAAAGGTAAGATAVADRSEAPAGVGAPPLSDATRLIPGVQSGQPAAAVATGPVGGTVSPVTPPPVSAAAGGNGIAAPPPSRQAADPPSRIQIRPGARAATPRSGPIFREPAQQARFSRGRQILTAAIVLLVVAAVVVVLLAVTSSGGTNTSATSGTRSNAPVAGHHPRTGALAPSAVKVAVLNGTATAGLAHRVALKLTGSGFKQGTVATATDQTRTATVVAYTPGRRRDAIAVASRLKLGSASVAPVDQSTQAVACPPPAPCTATVIVTVGSDLANIQ